MPIETTAIVKPMITAAVKKGAELFYNKYKTAELDRIYTLFAYVGEEMHLGESEDYWQKMLDQIDDPKIHAAVIDAARKAVDSFDEAPLPYIAKVVCQIKASNHVTIHERRLIRLLSECDHSLIWTLKHFTTNIFVKIHDLERNDGSFIVTATSPPPEHRPIAQVKTFHGSPVSWATEEYDYLPLFEILKRNYFGAEGDSGASGSIGSGPHILVIKAERLNLLQTVFAQ